LWTTRLLLEGTLLAASKTGKRGEHEGDEAPGSVLLALGILALAYGGFTYTKSTDKVNIDHPLRGEGQGNGEHPAVGGMVVAIVGGVLLARKN